MITLEAPRLHPSQQQIYDSPKRYRVVAAGRRFGKSKLAGVETLQRILNGKLCWWVLPTFDLGERVGWVTLKQLLAPLIANKHVKKNESKLFMKLPNGGECYIKSGDNPETLVGEGLDFVVIDEAGIIKPNVWFESIRPALMDTGGEALFIGTPKGHNWFWRLFNEGLDPLIDDIASWQFPTWANPFIPQSEIEKARGEMPERTFQQEIGAEFIEDAGMVFRGVSELATLQPQLPQPNHSYVFGVDWARSYDFTVVIVYDETTREVAWMDRFNQINWAVQRGRLAILAEQYKPRMILAESNSIGEPNIEALVTDGLHVEGFLTTAASKQNLINALSLAFEEKRIKLLSDPVLIGELQSYEMERLPGGSFRYNAPQGGHDDTVIALALAYLASTQHNQEMLYVQRAKAPFSRADHRVDTDTGQRR